MKYIKNKHANIILNVLSENVLAVSIMRVRIVCSNYIKAEASFDAAYIDVNDVHFGREYLLLSILASVNLAPTYWRRSFRHSKFWHPSCRHSQFWCRYFGTVNFCIVFFLLHDMLTRCSIVKSSYCK